MQQRAEFVWADGKAYHIGVAPGQLARNLMIVGDPARAARVAQRFDRIDGEYRHREYVTFTGALRGQAVSVMGTGIGTDNVEIALVEAVALWDDALAHGHRVPQRPRPKVIRVGTSGGAQPDVAAGTLAIAAYGLGLDSTGLYIDAPPADDHVVALEAQARAALLGATAKAARFYGQLPVYAAKADTKLTADLVDAVGRRNWPHEIGVSVAAPGFYAASGRSIDGMHNTVPAIKQALATVATAGMRVLNFEMECSLMFHLGAALELQCAMVCPVISQPGSHGRVVDYRPALDAAIDAALEVLCPQPA